MEPSILDASYSLAQVCESLAKQRAICYGAKTISHTFKKFDFPKPVYPVTRQCGYYSKSTITLLLVDSSLSLIGKIIRAPSKGKKIVKLNIGHSNILCIYKPGKYDD